MIRMFKAIKGNVKSDKELSFYDQGVFVMSFCYSGDKLNASGRSEAALTVRTRTR